MLQSPKLPVLFFFLKKKTKFDQNLIFTIDLAIHVPRWNCGLLLLYFLLGKHDKVNRSCLWKVALLWGDDLPVLQTSLSIQGHIDLYCVL